MCQQPLSILFNFALETQVDWLRISSFLGCIVQSVAELFVQLVRQRVRLYPQNYVLMLSAQVRRQQPLSSNILYNFVAFRISLSG